MADPRRTVADIVKHVVDYTHNGDIGTEANARALTNEIVAALDEAGWKQDASHFPPTVPVDDAVVALIRLPVGLTMLHDVATALDQHIGPGLVFRTDTGIDGWAVISRPSQTEGGRDA